MNRVGQRVSPLFFFFNIKKESHMDNDNLTAALEHLQNHIPDHIDQLKDLVRVPSISFPGFDPAPVRESAETVAIILAKSGLKDVRIFNTGAGHPSVYGQWKGNPGKPTILLYAHHDVQPVGREELWATPPFEPSERNGRLYGRGVSDDKGGVMMYAAAIRSYLASIGSLPVNVKVLIEGEEEVGSTNLDKLLQDHGELFSADVVLIADSENFDSGIPSLTASLRGIVTVNIEVRSLSSSVHSGTWGGPLPDPVLALAKMLTGLVDDQGNQPSRAFGQSATTLTERDRIPQCLAVQGDTLPKQSKILAGVQIIGAKARSTKNVVPSIHCGERNRSE
jgi:acetylornithine deacetylase/succinyl-diaminopimelate desuccinylase-like protein